MIQFTTTKNAFSKSLVIVFFKRYQIILGFVDLVWMGKIGWGFPNSDEFLKKQMEDVYKNE